MQRAILIDKSFILVLGDELLRNAGIEARDQFLGCITR